MRLGEVLDQLSAFPLHENLGYLDAYARQVTLLGPAGAGKTAALRVLADRYPDTVMVYPVHPNPNVRAPAEELLGGHDRIVLTTPVDYFDLVHALRHAALVVTDSGGIQEEAPSFGTPTLVLREVTERPEGVDAGVTVLVGTDRARILAGATAVLDNATNTARFIPPATSSSLAFQRRAR